MHVLLHADDTLIISTKPLIETMHVLLHADDTLIISTKPLIETMHVLLHADDTPCHDDTRYANQY